MTKTSQSPVLAFLAVAACNNPGSAGSSFGTGTGEPVGTSSSSSTGVDATTAIVDGTATDASSDSATGGPPKLDVGAPATGTTGEPMGCTYVDLLFVIDNSLSMSEYQAALAASFPAFVDEMYSQLPPATDLHVGITTTDFYCGSGSCSCSEFVFNCATTASDSQVLDHYNTPDQGNNGGNGSQGRLFEYGGMTYFATNTADDPAALKTWFTGAATAAGEDGCSFEMSSAGAAYAVGPDNAADNAGFLRDEGAVLMVFVLSDEPDKSPEDIAVYHDMVTAAKTGCGGDDCILTAGLLDPCVPDTEQTVWQFLSSFGKTPTYGSIEDTFAYSDVVGTALAQIVSETCQTIPPAG